jgi:hypothetical protein
MLRSGADQPSGGMLLGEIDNALDRGPYTWEGG